jgi:hypothetical protein
MIAAVKGLPQEILEHVDYREWSLRTLEGVARCRQLNARSLPSVAIAGKLIFEASIPESEELIAAIKNAEASGV